VYFQPLITGLNQIDLIQTITAVLASLPPQVVAVLLGNIVIVGGGSVISGLKERMERDLKRECPVDSKIHVRIGKGGARGAFFGMQYIGKHERDFL